MSSLESYKLFYEDLPIKNPKRVGRTVKMSKTTNTAEKPKKYNKTRGEHVKDLVIAVLVASIIAFIAGVQFADNQSNKVEAAVSEAQATMTAEAVETPVKK